AEDREPKRVRVPVRDARDRECSDGATCEHEAKRRDVLVLDERRLCPALDGGMPRSRRERERPALDERHQGPGAYARDRAPEGIRHVDAMRVAVTHGCSDESPAT